MTFETDTLLNYLRTSIFALELAGAAGLHPKVLRIVLQHAEELSSSQARGSMLIGRAPATHLQAEDPREKVFFMHLGMYILAKNISVEDEEGMKAKLKEICGEDWS